MIKIVSNLSIAILCLALIVQLRLSYLGLYPIRYDLPDLPKLSPDDRFSPSNGVTFEKLGENDLLYPESLVVSPEGKYLFISLGDGRIVRIATSNHRAWDNLSWHTIGRTGEDFPGCGLGGPSDDTKMEPKCGRPLGLWMVQRSTVDPNFEHLPKGEEVEDVLLVADAYKGFLMITNIYASEPQGRAEFHTLATRAKTDPANYTFSLLNAIVQAPSGDIYLTETSQTFQRRRIFHAAMDGGATGRLLRYRRNSGEGSVEVMADHMFMPNGIALSHDKKSLLIVGGVTMQRFDLATERLDSKPFVEVMPGTGDNIKAMKHLPLGQLKNCYWAGLGGKYAKPFSLLKALSDKPWLRSLVLAIVPYRKIINLIPKWTALAVYDEDGALVETLRNDGGVDENGDKQVVDVPWVSEVEPLGDYLYFASWYNPFLARIKRDSMIATN